MKRLLNIIFLFIITLFIFVFSNVNVRAVQPLDRIDYYEIKINPRQDATLDMHFKITWVVLDSDYDGPLEWIKIGIPNYHVDEIIGLSDNIDSIKYYAEGGSYIRIDLDRRYYAGAILDIEFQIHQKRMYNLNKDFCYYLYKPGWFNEIKVSKAVILWNKANVTDHNAPFESGEYLKWEQSLDFGETINVRVVYNKNTFINLSYDEMYTDAYLTPEAKRRIIIIIGIIIAVLAIIIIVYRSSQDPYLYERGFYGRRYYRWYMPRRYYRSGVNSHGTHIHIPTSHHGGGSGGGSCACACACACAGGGRAGCSKKDFYNKNLKISQIQKALEE